MNQDLLKIIDEIAQNRGLTKKNSERLVLDLIQRPEQREALTQTLETLGDKFSLCERCFGVAKSGECLVCDDPQRSASVICVVGTLGDLLNIEKYRQFKGTYAVLQGEIKLNRNIGPEQLKIAPLMERAQEAEEIILALNNTFEGEVTANYLIKLLAPIPQLKISRLAKGLPMGGMLDYVDETTLFNALNNRQKVEG